MVEIFKFLKNSGGDIAFFAIIVVVVILFLKDFELSSKRSWAILLGLVALGGFFTIRSVKKNKLLKELAEREARLKQIEERYETLKNEKKISQVKYEKARNELEQAKADAAKAVLSADEDYNREIERIQQEQTNITPAELILQAKEIIKNTRR
jgi:hypothetical protein